MSPTSENKSIAKLALTAFGNNPEAKVINYREDDNKESCIPILICPNSPDDKLPSYSTIGLSDYPMFQNQTEFPVRVEIVGACSTVIKWFPHLIAACAFHVAHSGWLCRPGAVLENANSNCSEDSNFKHVYFTAPFLWEESLTTLNFPTKQVAWLLAIPITNQEYDYIKVNGDEKFEDLLELKEVDIFDLNRQSAV
jgi:antitoxin YqcF